MRYNVTESVETCLLEIGERKLSYSHNIPKSLEIIAWHAFKGEIMDSINLEVCKKAAKELCDNCVVPHEVEV